MANAWIKFLENFRKENPNIKNKALYAKASEQYHKINGKKTKSKPIDKKTKSEPIDKNKMSYDEYIENKVKKNKKTYNEHLLNIESDIKKVKEYQNELDNLVQNHIKDVKRFTSNDEPTRIIIKNYDKAVERIKSKAFKIPNTGWRWLSHLHGKITHHPQKYSNPINDDSFFRLRKEDDVSDKHIKDIKKNIETIKCLMMNLKKL